MSKRKVNLDPVAAESGLFPAASTELADALRAHAQAAVEERAAQYPEELSAWSSESSRKLVYELRVHQVELELQNEELQRAQRAVEASRARYLDLYDAAPVGYVTVAENGSVIEGNLTAAGMLGLPLSGLLEQPLTRFIAPEDQDIYFRHRRALLLGGTPQACELRLRTSSGTTFWAGFQATTADNADGTTAFRTVISDITARKLTEQALEQSEARHRVLFQSSPAALMTLEPRGGRFASGNATAVSMFGAIDEADFLTRSFAYYSPEVQPDGSSSHEAAAAMLELAMQHGSHSFAWTHRRASGEEFEGAVVLARVATPGPPLLGASVRDETAAQKRRIELAQAERLTSMGMLAASVGHEINNPLAYVLASVESLARSLPQVATAVNRCAAGLRRVGGDALYASAIGEHARWLEPASLAEACEHARDALDGAQRITRIARVLSTFSRVDTIELTKVDLVRAIQGAVSIAHNEIRFRAKLVQELAPVPSVLGSEGKLSQVFLNLLVNATHAMDRGSAADHRLTIRTWSEGSQVLAEVKDTGSGIAKEHLPRIFEPFFSTKANGQGSGLGLSICRTIVADFGGTIEVESTPGEGTRVMIRLPAAEQPTRSPPSEPLPSAPEQPTPRGRILIIDDEAPLRRAMMRLLAYHDVVPAASGMDALALLSDDRDFDVVLCDLMMPELSGMALQQWLQIVDPVLAKRVVFVTGGAFGRVYAEYLVQCGSLTIEKPFDNDTFVRVVSELVCRVWASGTSPRR